MHKGAASVGGLFHFKFGGHCSLLESKRTIVDPGAEWFAANDPGTYFIWFFYWPQVQYTLQFDSMDENRASPRLRTLKGGSIIFGLAPGVDCVIRNMSDTGACLEVKGTVGIPDDFILLIKPEILKRNCHVAWRSAHRIGVLFR
jgi:hypothetical protein